jgi:hypothetical protein
MGKTMLKITTIITALLLSFPGYLLSAKNVNIARAVYGTKALIEYQNKQTEAASAIDGSYDDNSSVTFPGVPAKLILNFPSQYKVYKVRIYPGMLIYANYPSSECGIKFYRIEGLINGGWKLLAKNNNVPDYKKSGHQGNENHFFEHKFEPIKIEALRLVVLESGFTGKTSTSKGKVVVAAEKRHSFIREIEAFETDSKISKIKLLDDKIDSDFRLPVYRDQKQANLVIINKEKKPLDLNLSITGEKNPDKIILERKLKLNSGRNEFKFDISQLKNGRYLTILEPHKNSSLKGRVIRLLRIDRLPEAVLPKEPIDVSNLKVFPFDNYYIAKRSGVKNKLAQAEIHQAAGLLAPNRIQQRAWNMNFDEKNNLVIKFFDATRSGKDRKWHYAWSIDLKNWTIGDKTPTGKEVYNPRAPEFPAEVQPDWKVTAKNNENVFRFYDSKRDEKPEVNQIYVKYSSVKKVNWGKVDIPYRSTFAVWQKKNGEVVILDKEPFLIDKVSFKKDEFEKENYTNDNFAPQYLGNKGEVLYYPRGAMVRRFKPFTAEYDNLAQGFRLLKIFYTRDGFNWKQTFFTLPTEKDPWGYQHYGANIIRIPRADLFIAYLYVYDVAKQQIYLEINYSRDGLRWERMYDQPPFVSNGKLGEWNSGMVFLDGRHIERDGVYYHIMGHTTSACHFYVPCYRDNTSGMSPEALERRFKSRELEKWPYFKQIGGWQGLSEEMFAAHASTGVLTFRKDSWIGVNADNTGSLITKILKAADCKLIVNALIRDGGSVKVEVLSEDNTEIPMYSGENAAILTEDNTAAELKWNHGKLERLPEGSFRLRISLEKAALYTLDFINSKRLITSQDFEDEATFNSSLKGSIKQLGNPDIHWRNFQPETVEVTKEKNNNNQAVLLTRVDGAEGLSLRGFEVGKDKNYCLTFSAKRYPKSNFGVSFDCFSPKKNVFSLYITPDGKVNVKSGKQRPHYLPTSIVLKTDKWYKISVDFDSDSRSYFIKAVDDENIEQKSKRKISLPVVEKINMISFRPAPGAGNKTLIDNIKLNEK